MDLSVRIAQTTEHNIFFPNQILWFRTEILECTRWTIEWFQLHSYGQRTVRIDMSNRSCKWRLRMDTVDECYFSAVSCEWGTSFFGLILAWDSHFDGLQYVWVPKIGYTAIYFVIRHFFFLIDAISSNGHCCPECAPCKPSWLSRLECRYSNPFICQYLLWLNQLIHKSRPQSHINLIRKWIILFFIYLFSLAHRIYSVECWVFLTAD